ASTATRGRSVPRRERALQRLRQEAREPRPVGGVDVRAVVAVEVRPAGQVVELDRDRAGRRREAIPIERAREAALFDPRAFAARGDADRDHARALSLQRGDAALDAREDLAGLLLVRRAAAGLRGLELLPEEALVRIPVGEWIHAVEMDRSESAGLEHR